MLPSVPGLGPARITLRPATNAAESLPPLQSAKLLDRLRERIRYLHYSQRTEEAYVFWCRAFFRWHGLHHPADMGNAEVEAFLTYLAAERGLAPSTHKQAFSACSLCLARMLCTHKTEGPLGRSDVATA